MEETSKSLQKANADARELIRSESQIHPLRPEVHEANVASDGRRDSAIFH